MDRGHDESKGKGAWYPSQVYQPQRAERRSGVVRGITPIYISALGLIAFLSFASYYILDQILKEQGKSAAVINVSGPCSPFKI